MANAGALLPEMQHGKSHLLRVTRDADIEIREDEAGDLLRSMQQGLRRRRFGSAVRLEVSTTMPAKMVEYLMTSLDLFARDERFSAVMGNHDLAISRYWRDETDSLKSAQRKAAAQLERGRERYAGYLASLPLMLDFGSRVVVHAGVRPGVPPDSQSVDDLTALRTLGPDRTSREGALWYEAYRGEKTILFGHWPSNPPRRGPNAIGLDTGCVYGNDLTAYIIETGEFISVRSRRAYSVPKWRRRSKVWRAQALLKRWLRVLTGRSCG